MPGLTWICCLLSLVFAALCAAETKPPPASRAFHFAGGRVKSQVKLGENYSVAFFLWNALPSDARAVTGYAFSRGRDGDALHGEHLGIGGNAKLHFAPTDKEPPSQGRLILFNGNTADQLLIGKTKLALKAWHHVVLVREGPKVRVHLDGKPVPDLEGELPVKIESEDVFIGGRADNFANWEGKLDEVAIFDRALTPNEASALYQAAKIPPPVEANAAEFPPLSPEDGLKSIHVPDGFKVELVACEPNVIDPIAIDWDLAGRLWVVEMADYPSGMDGNGKPGGRVRVLEDTDGDGKYEKSTLFTDGLNFPTGLLTWRDGVIVTAAPDVLFLKDTNGDGKADSTEKLLSGLSEGNQQLRANGLRWGLDNRVYCAAGGHHGGHAADTVLRSHKDGKDEKIGSRDFSFDPDTGNVRAESGPSQFGRNRDDAGHWFGTQNSRALWHYVLPDHYLKRNPHVPAPDPTHLIVTPLNAPVYPVSPPEKRFHSFENANHFTSACSGMIYRDELLWPRRENELDAFTCEPFHNLVQHNILVEDGVTWKARRSLGEEKHDFFASSDRWCRPVMTRTGPDGALWVVDMYRYMIEHPAWLPENGRAELLPHYRLGDDKGRIYRVFRADKPPRKVKPMDKLKPVELVQALDSPNEWQRDKAHMALVWFLSDYGRSEYLNEPISAQRMKDRDDAGAAFRHAMHSANALCRLTALAILPFNDFQFLGDTNPAVRMLMLRSLEDTALTPAPILAALPLAADPNQKVRLQFILTAGSWWRISHADLSEADEVKLHRRVGEAIATAAAKSHRDPFVRAAVMSSAVPCFPGLFPKQLSATEHLPHFRGLVAGLVAAGDEVLDSFANDLLTLALALNDRDSLNELLRPVFAKSVFEFDAGQMTFFARFLDALARHHTSLEEIREERDALGRTLRRAAGIFGFARGCFANRETAPALRTAAARLLIRNNEERPAALSTLATWLEPGQPESLQLAAPGILAESGDAAVPGALLKHWGSSLPKMRNTIIEALLSREPWALALLEHVKSNPALALDATQRARLAQHSSKKVRDLAAAVLKTESSRKEVLEQFRPALSLKGDAVRGKTVALRCIGCHQVDGAGLKIGPDLKSVASHPAEKLLTNIIDPSLDVQPGFFAYNAKLKDGSELYGLVTAETGNSVIFKLTDGSMRHIARSDLADLKSTGQSLMPPGLETGMTAQEMADLIAWLRGSGAGDSPGK
jgi:putative membrane-bound dehydrogenase-like protein